MQFATDPDTLSMLTTLMRTAVPPHCFTEGSGVADLALGSHCLACIKVVLEKGQEHREEFVAQAKHAELARCLLQFLEWDHTSTGTGASSGENYTNRATTTTGLAENGKVSLRVYSVSVIKLLLHNEQVIANHEETSATLHTQQVIQQQFTSVWAAYKEQSLDLFVTETERRRLMLGDVVAQFLTNE
jgi:hypothetical protein